MHWIRRHTRGRPPHPDVLTPAEWRVVDLARAGRTNPEIAEQLGITVPTVKTHMSRILDKLDVPDRRALAAWEGQPAVPTVEASRRSILAVPLGWLSSKTAGGVVVVAGLAVLLAGFVAAMESGRLTGGDVSPPPPSPTATETPEAEATPTAPAAATAGTSPPSVGLLLIDLSSGATHTLYSGEEYALTHGFEADGSLWVWRNATQSATRYGPDGQPVEETDAWPWADQRCRNLPGTEASSEVAGEVLPIPCGLLSPDGRWMFFTRDIDSAGTAAGAYESVLYDLDAGVEHLLTDRTRHCGGCDYRAGPSWSPSGRFLLFGETYAGPDSTIYLTDVMTLSTREVVQGQSVNNLGAHLVWSPVEDAFVRPGPGDATVIERPALAAALDLSEVSWPARFDASGEFVYSLRDRTVVMDATSGGVLADWEGATQAWPLPRGVTEVAGEPAALTEGDGCAGTVVHHPEVSAPCLQDARGAVWSPAADMVAFWSPAADMVAFTRQVVGSSGSSSQDWEIVVFDLATERERTVLPGIGGSPSWGAPFLTWNEAGSQLVVVSPPPEVLW